MTLNTVSSGRNKIYPIAQAVICGLGLITGIPASLFLFIISFFDIVNGANTPGQSNLTMVYAFTLLFFSLALIPGLITAIYRLQNKAEPKLSATWKKILPIAAMIIWVGCLGLSLLINNWGNFTFINAIFVVPLVVIPLYFIVLLGARKLSMGNNTRIWGAIAFNFSITMPLVLMVELVLLLFLIIIMVFWLSNQPDLLTQILSFGDSLSQQEIDPKAAEALLTNFIRNPVVLNAGILILSVLIPLIEEFFKPMALWFLAGKKLTPSQGFIGGLIAGACFAAIETLGSIGAPFDNTWYMLLFGRIGTGLLHISLSGIVGWGIASAFYLKKWWLAIVYYLAAVLMHGTWNLFALLSGIMPIITMPEQFATLPAFFSQSGPYFLITLAAMNLLILLQINRKLQLNTVQYTQFTD